jgi:branched-chain amino acid transport system substrate-binding protein
MQYDKRYVPGFLSLVFLCGALVVTSSTNGQTRPTSTSDAKESQTPPRYANMPVEAVPYGKFAKPYKEWYLTEDTLEYDGNARARDYSELAQEKSVNIGFLGPIENNPESPYGLAMLRGAQLAIEQANAQGGYQTARSAQGKPYELKVHNDSAQWGASSTEAVKMIFDEHVVGVLGSVDGASTHIMLRVSLKLEFPIVDSATTDPTVTETRIQWLLHDFPDDRQQGYTLASVVFKERQLKRIGIIRTQSRYARIGVEKFFDEAKRMGHVPVLEVKFERGDKDFSTQLRMLQNARVDGVVIWGEVPEAAKILAQMRAMGLKQPVFGPSRLCYPQIIEAAGPAAEGLVATAPLDPTRSDARWLQFEKNYRAKYQVEPDAYAAYAFDAINLLIGAVAKAGLNRGKIMDALLDHQGHEYDGVAGRFEFDHTLNNIAPLNIARVEGGKFIYSAAKTNTLPASADRSTLKLGTAHVRKAGLCDLFFIAEP